MTDAKKLNAVSPSFTYRENRKASTQRFFKGDLRVEHIGSKLCFRHQSVGGITFRLKNLQERADSTIEPRPRHIDQHVPGRRHVLTPDEAFSQFRKTNCACFNVLHGA